MKKKTNSGTRILSLISHHLLALVACMLVLGMSAAALTAQTAEPLARANPDFVDALWVADKEDALLKIGLAEASLLLEILDIEDVRAVAVDDRRALVWAYGKNLLYAFGFDGTLRLAVPVVRPDEEDEDKDEEDEDEEDAHSQHVDLQVNSKSGTVWLGLGRFLFQYDSNAQLLAVLPLPETVRALALDQPGSLLWLATRELLISCDETASVLQILDLGKGARIEDIDLDAASGEIWVAQKERLTRLDASGRLLFERRIKKLSQVVSDHQGGAWLARGKWLIRIDPSGEILFELERLGKKPEKLLSLAADPLDASVWVATKKGLAKVSADGEVLQILEWRSSKKKKVRARDVALYVDLIPPEIAFTSPGAGAFIKDSTPVIDVSYSDTGSGVDPSTLHIEMGAQQLIMNCSYEEKTASCVPSNGLPEGEIQLSAGLEDFNGNLSDPASLVCTVDTLPPLITLLSPSDGLLTNQPEQRFTGQINEPATLTLDGQAVSLTKNQHFDELLILQEGSNIFTLVATDQAGNAGSLTIEISLDTIAPAIAFTAPVGGSIVNTTTPTIEVSYSDSGSGVKVGTLIIQADGIQLGVTCTFTSASASCTPKTALPEGANTLTATIRDLAGNLSAPAQVGFTIQPVVGNRPPLLDPVGDQTLALGSRLTLTLTATDPEADLLAFSALPLPLPANSSLNASTGVFTFTPAADQVGTITLTFIVGDGVLSDSETINISVEGAAPGGVTELTGRLLDSNAFALGQETPVVGATVSLLDTGFSSISDTGGNFTLSGIAAGAQILDIDSSTANAAPDASPYAGFREEIELISGVTNVIDRPLFLPHIAANSLTPVNPNFFTTVTNPELGVSLSVPPSTAKN
ncbi:Ig-like domain-containing protein, partial [Acidobacteria bacterium AH-259-L09]|nr:Ig-like domain-containing protein [Acidobacteria bacterium AH-259-L09]